MQKSQIVQVRGNVYRPALRCHIEPEAPGIEGEWAFEVMIGTIDPDSAYELDNATRVVTSDAWRELATRGAQIATWKYDHTTEKDGWIMNQTGAEDSAIPQKDLVLGEEKTAVFFCVRLSGHKPNGVVMDAVRLVDVTDGFLNPQQRDTAF